MLLLFLNVTLMPNVCFFPCTVCNLLTLVRPQTTFPCLPLVLGLWLPAENSRTASASLAPAASHLRPSVFPSRPSTWFLFNQELKIIKLHSSLEKFVDRTKLTMTSCSVMVKQRYGTHFESARAEPKGQCIVPIYMN